MIKIVEEINFDSKLLIKTNTIRKVYFLGILIKISTRKIININNK